MAGLPQLVQKGKKLHLVFLECGEDNDFETGQMEDENLRGWLMTEKQADQFECEWRKNQPGEEWEKISHGRFGMGSRRNLSLK